MQFRLRILALRSADILWESVFVLLQDYLTSVWGLSFTDAAAHMNIWGGVRRILPIFSLFIAQVFLGNFIILLISGLAYSVGMVLLTLSLPPVIGISTSVCEEYDEDCVGNTQKNLFLTGMTLIGLGIAGQDASLDCFIQEQHRTFEFNIRQLVVPFLTYMFPPAIAFLVFPYLRDWFLLFGFSTIFMAIPPLLFLTGYRNYRILEPQGSILTVVCRVFVAVAFKISQPFPPTSNQLFNEDSDKNQLLNQETGPLRPSRFLRWLEKAAIILPDTSVEEQKKNKWKLCSIAEVECAKIVVRMVPIWTTFIMCSIVSSIGDTYFIQQAIQMKRNIGKWKVPLQVFLALYFSLKHPFNASAKRILKNSDPYGGPKGLGIAIISSTLCCVAAALVERRRLTIVREHYLVSDDDFVPMSAYWLFFQISLLAGLDSFFERGADLFIHNQGPKRMRKCLDFLNKGVTGLGFLFGVLTVHVVERRTEWFVFNLNLSRLDNYYWLLAVLSCLNFILFVVIAWFYRYSNWEAPVDQEVVDDHY